MKDFDYPYLRAWCDLHGSTSHWKEMELRAAREQKAPADAIYRNNFIGGDGKWHRFSEVTNPQTIFAMEQTHLPKYLDQKESA